jgi:hypothetical protein
LKYAIQPAFEQYDYILFLQIAEMACLEKYGTFSTKAYHQLFEDFELDKHENMRTKINALWKNYGKEMGKSVEELYKLHSGDCCDFYDIYSSLDTLAEYIKDYYQKKVIILVDNFDAPAQKLIENVSFFNSEDNKQLMKSVDYLSYIITIILQAVGKSCRA